MRLAMSWSLLLLAGLVFSFLIHHVGDLSRLWMLYWYLTGLCLLLTARAGLYLLLRMLLRLDRWTFRTADMSMATNQSCHHRGAAVRLPMCFRNGAHFVAKVVADNGAYDAYRLGTLCYYRMFCKAIACGGIAFNLGMQHHDYRGACSASAANSTG